MKKYIFTTPLLVAVCAVLFCNAANAQKKICMKAENPSDAIVSIMSYNIHNGTGMDGIRDYGRIAQVIKEIDPDVVALQEVDSVNARNGNLNGAAEIANAAGMHWTFGASLKNFRGGAYGNAILSKEKPLSYKNIPLESPNDEDRALLIVEFKDYYFCCAHLSLNDTDRDESCVTILNEMRKLSGKKLIFLSGDFNSLPGSHSVALLMQSFEILSNPAVFTFPSVQPDRTIDYICLYKNKAGKNLIKNFKEGKNGLATWVQPETAASDHRPEAAVIIKGTSFIQK
jgi:endonuclease/exonuclease/phosphatase family metal-dependent hydrolase